MFPEGFVPGTDDLEVYRTLYADPSFSLNNRIQAVDISVLSARALATICRRNAHETGVGLENSPWLEPVDDRFGLAQISLRFCLADLEAREFRFRKAVTSDEEDLPAAFKALRTTFVTALGAKVALEYVRQELERTSPEEREQQKRAYEEKEKAWREKQARRNKIYEIAREHPGFASEMETDGAYYVEKYALTEEDLKELDLMVEEERKEARKRAEIPFDHVERYDWREGYYSVPVLTEKIRMIRKAAKITQRDFAKLIGYRNANKYAKLERGELGSPRRAEKMELIRDVCDATGANPYWLENDSDKTVYDVRQDETAATAAEADSLDDWPMYATRKVVREWWVERKRLYHSFWE